VIEIPHGVTLAPHATEALAAFQAGARRMAWRWHRQGHKTQTSLALLAVAAYETAGAYAFVSPTFRMSKMNVFHGLRHDGTPYLDVIPPELILARNENDMTLTMQTREAGKTSRLLFASADDPDRLRGLALRGVILDEFATMTTAEALHVVRPAIEASGGWLLIISTPKGLNHFHDLWKSVEGDPAWWLSVKTIEDTGLIPLSVVEQELREGQSKDWVDQEYFVRFTAALVGSYFGDLLSKAEAEGRITDLSHRPGQRVVTGWDLGISDLMVVVYFQSRADTSERINVLGADAWEGHTVPEVLAAMQPRGYVIGEHLMPHDADTRNVVTKVTPAEVARGLGYRVRVVPRSDLLPGINAVRALFPRLVFDRRGCATLLEMLAAYIKRWDEKNKVFQPKPAHTQASHFADALRTFAVGYRERRDDRPQGPQYAITSTARRRDPRDHHQTGGYRR
jgi:hypothetical protein